VTTEEFSWPLRVYIEDTDAGGIVFYVNYLKYMERARTELLRSAGFDKNHIFNAELMFVVSSVEVRYRAPARLDDELLATARIVENRAAQLIFEQRILRGAEQLCGGHVDVACVDRATLRPRRIPKTLLQALNIRSGSENSSGLD
jgi:tol-pal system-associated acyl-CoA thioesterase